MIRLILILVLIAFAFLTAIYVAKDKGGDDGQS
jgi:hypothetical protein